MPIEFWRGILEYEPSSGLDELLHYKDEYTANIHERVQPVLKNSGWMLAN